MSLSAGGKRGESFLCGLENVQVDIWAKWRCYQSALCCCVIVAIFHQSKKWKLFFPQCYHKLEIENAFNLELTSVPAATRTRCYFHFVNVCRTQVVVEKVKEHQHVAAHEHEHADHDGADVHRLLVLLLCAVVPFVLHVTSAGGETKLQNALQI